MKAPATSLRGRLPAAKPWTRTFAANVALDRIVPALVVAYAIWTVYVHLLTATHSSFTDLLRWTPLLLLVAVAAALGWSVWPRAAAPGRGGPATAAAQANVGGSAATPAVDARTRPLLVLALASLWAGLLAAGMPYPLFWWIALLGMGWAWVGHGLRCAVHAAPADPDGVVAARQARWIVLLVSACAVLVTLVANRPDPDDALHLSIPATLLRFPQQPVLLHDTLYRLADAPILTPFYRLNSYDVLIGLLARVTGIDLHVIAYLVLPSLLAVVAVLAWAYLLRRIVPERWPAVLPVLFLVVLALGEAHRAYGNFAFVRLFQGKAVLATCMVPVIVGAALSFARDGGVRRWLLLLAAQIAALGFAATALFVAPAAAALGLAGGWSANRRSSRRLVLGLLASSYVFAAAWVLASTTHGGQGFASSNPMPPVPWILASAWGSWSTPVLLAALLAAWAFVRDPVRARYLSAGAFFFLLAVLDPYTCRFVADHFAGVYTYWRLTWALPLPFLLAVVLDGAASRALRLRPRALAGCLLVAMAGLAIGFGWQFGTLRAGNGVTLGVPRPKVYPVEYRVAEQLVRDVPEQGAVLAPEYVSFWLPTFVVHPHLVGVRIPYLTQGFAPPEASRRRALMRYVAGEARTADSAQLLAGALHRYRLTAVVFRHSAPWRAEMEDVLAGQRWRLLAGGAYDIWMRGGDASRRATPRPCAVFRLAEGSCSLAAARIEQ